VIGSIGKVLEPGIAGPLGRWTWAGARPPLPVARAGAPRSRIQIPVCAGGSVVLVTESSTVVVSAVWGS